MCSVTLLSVQGSMSDVVASLYQFELGQQQHHGRPKYGFPLLAPGTHTHTEREREREREREIRSWISVLYYGPYVAVSLNTGELASYQRKMASFRTAYTCSSFTKQIVVLLYPQGTICFSFSPVLHLSFHADTYTASRK